MSFMDNFYLTGKKAIISGGAKGLGLGMTKALCQAGAEVVIISSSDMPKKNLKSFVSREFQFMASRQI